MNDIPERGIPEFTDRELYLIRNCMIGAFVSSVGPPGLHDFILVIKKLSELLAINRIYITMEEKNSNEQAPEKEES